MSAEPILRLAEGFLIVWGVVVLLHGALASLSPRGNPLPPEPEPDHHEH